MSLQCHAGVADKILSPLGKPTGMRGCRSLLLHWLFCGHLLCCLVGCGPNGPSTAPDESPIASSEFDYTQMIDGYMPPLEQGRLELAPPKDWVFSRPGSDYLVGFHPSGSSLNQLPRVLISVQESPFDPIQDLNPTNASSVIQSITESLSEGQFKSPPALVGLGGRTWIEFVGLGRRRGTLVARQYLQTIVEGRLFEVRLEVADRNFEAHRHQGYAVAATAKFSQPPAEAAPVDAGDGLEEAEKTDSIPFPPTPPTP